MAKCIQCRKRCQQTLGCPFCGAQPLCLKCTCKNCLCTCSEPEPVGKVRAFFCSTCNKRVIKRQVIKEQA